MLPTPDGCTLHNALAWERSESDDDAFYLFLQKQKLALEPYTLPPGTPHHTKRKKNTCDDVTTMTLMVQW